MKGSKFLAGLLSACMLFSSLPVTATESEIRVGVETEENYSSEDDDASVDLSDGGNEKSEAVSDGNNDDKGEEEEESGTENGVEDEAVADESAEDEMIAQADDTLSLTDDVEINEENFPDEVFRNYVSENFDADRDGLLSGEEIGDVNAIDVYNSGVESLKGIENFVNLNYLDCTLNHLENIDVSNNTALEGLNCSK